MVAAGEVVASKSHRALAPHMAENTQDTRPNRTQSEAEGVNLTKGGRACPSRQAALYIFQCPVAAEWCRGLDESRDSSEELLVAERE